MHLTATPHRHLPPPASVLRLHDRHQRKPRGLPGVGALRGIRGLRGVPGFTLVEILIVVVILGILAAIVVPQFTSAAAESRENCAKMSLYRIRTQMELYKEQHNQTYPTLAAYSDQMTQATDVDGTVVALGTPKSFGPYIREVPPNPATGGHTMSAGGVGTSDWYYNEATGELRANDSDVSRTY